MLTTGSRGNRNAEFGEVVHIHGTSNTKTQLLRQCVTVIVAAVSVCNVSMTITSRQMQLTTMMLLSQSR